MKRDIELERKILFLIEGKYQAGQGHISNLNIEGYDMATVAEHCDLLSQQGLIKNYKSQYASNELVDFGMGNLTAQGYDYLELIRNEKVWEQTKAEIETKNLPATVEVITRLASIFLANFFKEMSNL